MGKHKSAAYMKWMKANDLKIAKQINKELRGAGSSYQHLAREDNWRNACKEKGNGTSASIYIFQSGMTTLCKIGRSANPTERLKDLRAGNPHLRPVVVVRVKDARAAEKMLHLMFKKFRCEREFFNLEQHHIETAQKYLESIRG